MSHQHSSRALPSLVCSPLAALRAFTLVLVLVMVAGACSADATVEVTTAGRALAAGEANAAAATDAATDDATADSQIVDDADSEAATSAAGAIGSGDVVAFQATPAFLAYAAAQVETAPSYRFEFYQDISGGIMAMGSRDVPLMTGDAVGTTSQMRMDMSSMFAGMPIPGMDAGMDLSMNIITDESSLYLNAPLFQSLLGGEGAAPLPGMEWMDTVATGWGRIDLAELVGGDVLSEFGMGSAVDSSQLLTMLDSVGEVLDGGASEVRGEATRVVYATVSLADMAETLGDSAADLDIPADMINDLPPVSVEVHLDASNYVRRITYTIDLATMMPDSQDLGANMVMWQQIDFFDFGQPIEIAVPAGALDITEDFAQLAELGG